MLSDGPKVVRFSKAFLTLNGSFKGQPFVPLRWMEEAFADIFRLNEDGRRRFRTYLLGVPRKNAKSTIGAALAVYMLFVDRTDSAPVVISAAGDRKQARLVFEMARDMILACPDLHELCTVYRDEIRTHRGGLYKAVSADAGLAHGLNPSVVIVDEYHVHKTDDLYVALTTGSAMGNQPLTLVITTAGFDETDSPLGRLYTYGRKVQAGEIVDPSFGMTWYGPPDGEYDYTDPAVWEACNPSWEIMNHEEMASSCRQMPESEFIRYRLNGWTSTENAFLPAGAWDALEDADKGLEPGDAIVLGFDGAWKNDSTALVAVRLSDLYVEPIGVWEAPPGDNHWRAPTAEIEEAIREACDLYAVREVTMDPFRWEQSLNTLTDEGLPIVEFPTNAKQRMIPATGAFYNLVMEGKLSHNGDPTLARHLRNAVAKSDARGTWITREGKASSKHIDAAVATIIGVHRALLWREETVSAPSIYLL